MHIYLLYIRLLIFKKSSGIREYCYSLRPGSYSTDGVVLTYACYQPRIATRQTKNIIMATPVGDRGVVPGQFNIDHIDPTTESQKVSNIPGLLGYRDVSKWKALLKCCMSTHSLICWKGDCPTSCSYSTIDPHSRVGSKTVANCAATCLQYVSSEDVATYVFTLAHISFSIRALSAWSRL